MRVITPEHVQTNCSGRAESWDTALAHGENMASKNSQVRACATGTIGFMRIGDTRIEPDLRVEILRSWLGRRLINRDNTVPRR